MTTKTIEEQALYFKMALGYIDSLANNEDIEILERLLEQMQNNHGYNQAISIAAVACGSKNYDSDGEMLKIDELERIIALAKIRKEMRENSDKPEFDGNSLYRWRYEKGRLFGITHKIIRRK